MVMAYTHSMGIHPPVHARSLCTTQDAQDEDVRDRGNGAMLFFWGVVVVRHSPSRREQQGTVDVAGAPPYRELVSATVTVQVSGAMRWPLRVGGEE